jgi:hypothetical protein
MSNSLSTPGNHDVQTIGTEGDTKDSGEANPSGGIDQPVGCEEGEAWDELFCLDPANSSKPAAESLADEIKLARRYTEAEEALGGFRRS